MADLAKLEAALVKADAAGDTEGARILAGEVRKMRAAPPERDSTLMSIAKVATAPAAAVGETALQLGTGLAGSVAGGLSGLGNLATNALGLTDRNPADTVAKVSNALTYEPRTAPGKAVSEAVAKPFELYAQGADWAGGKATDAATALGANPETAATIGAGVNTGIQALPMALGPIAKAIPGESAAAVAARAGRQVANAPVDAGIAAAREAKLVITPAQAEAGGIPRTMESLAGSARMEKLASKKNAPTINSMIRKDIGIPDDVPTTRDAIAAIRNEEGKAYEVVKGSGRVATDAKFKADLYAITKSFDTAAKDFAHRSENPFKKTLDGLSRSEFDAASAVEEVKLLRLDADKAYRTGDPALGKAFKKAGQALDDQLDRHMRRIEIENGGNPDVASQVADYRAARVKIAKTYAADKALNETTGNFDAGAYGKALKDGKPLTGEALKVGQFARQFEKSAQRVEKTGNIDASFADLLLAGAGGLGGLALHGAAGGGAALPLLLARPATRAAMLSGIGQDALTAPRTYGRPGIRSLQDLLEQRGSAAGAVGTSAGRQ